MSPQPPMGNQINDRRTPLELFKRYDDRYHFTLDAAASHENALAPAYCTLDGTYQKDPSPDHPWLLSKHDGLAHPWTGEVVWVNPPYGRGLLAPFIEKARHEAKFHSVTVVMLLPVRTEQPWWHDIVVPDLQSGLAQINWVRGRLKFSGLAAAPFPSMVVIWNG